MFFAKLSEAGDTDGGAEGMSGSWVVGPTMNSDRCTAFVDETAESLLCPPPTQDGGKARWKAFDVVST